LNPTENQPDSLLLIGPDDPPPYVVLHEQGTAPALLVCDHASRAFPRAMQRLGLPELATWQHVAWDIGAGELTRGLANALDAPAVLAGYSRLVADCNRDPQDASVFRQESDGWVVPGNQAVTEGERNARLRGFFEPYHARIETSLEEMCVRGVVPLFISVHTFTPVLGGQSRPWHVGVLWDADEPNARRLMAGLSSVDGLVVGDNQPYSGRHPADYTIDHHADRAGLPHLCIEVRQDQVESPAGVELWVRRLSGLIGDMLGDPAVHRLLHQESAAWRPMSRR
jgi:predicted N-formylglutamate amidohydrolase